MSIEEQTVIRRGSAEGTSAAPDLDPSSSDDYEQARQRHVRALAERLPAEVERVTWPLERLHALRDARLRALVRTAKARSPWHARRLRHIDPETLRGDDLAAIPPMTKADVMANWDEIVTDRRLTLAVAEAHLARVAEHGPAYLLDEYHVVSSGGSSGRRGVFVWDFEGWLQAAVTSARRAAWLGQRRPISGPQRSAYLGAERAIHIGTAMTRTLARPPGSSFTFPVTLPLAEIVAGLNACQPTTLSGYPSVVHVLALEARAGRLRIAPQAITTGGEPLPPDTRQLVAATFGAVINEGYVCSEAWVMAVSYPGTTGLYLNEDSAVYEFLDAAGHPMPPGETAARFLVTNVINQALPLLRYELNDEVTLLDGPNPGPWTGRRIAPVGGRLDDLFVYADGVVAHPHVFRSALGSVPAIAAYQVRQTARGAAIAVEAVGAADLEPVRQEVAAALARLGLAAPEVVVERVDRIERTAVGGKVRRFLPLASQQGMV